MTDEEKTNQLPVAPKNNLPSWNKCKAICTKTLDGESRYIDGQAVDHVTDSDIGDPIVGFIYEYDDADDYKSAWFRYRLEKLIDYVRDTAIKSINDDMQKSEMSIKTASEQLDEFIASMGKKCNDERMDLRIENGRIYVYKYFYESDGSFASIKKPIDTAPF